jgi:hypothetical protein
MDLLGDNVDTIMQNRHFDSTWSFFKKLNAFRALHFTGTPALTTTRSMRILPMKQPIMFGMKGSN